MKRLLESIGKQDYNNFEVVITDDSGADNAIEHYIDSNHFKFPLSYIKNKIPLGSPLNWIESIKHAKGEWIKIMHDDDAFFGSDSLRKFSQSIYFNTDVIFSGYVIHDEKSDSRSVKLLSKIRFQQIKKNPFLLFASNEIGPPSVMLFKKSITEQFDNRLKWIVDWEFYIRVIKKYKAQYIHDKLVVISYNESQITNQCIRNPAIEIYETMIFYDLYGKVLFKHILLFDAWWRLIRNLKIDSIEDFSVHTYLPIPDQIRSIIKFQSIFPNNLLRIGFFSKLYMTICYLYCRANGF